MSLIGDWQPAKPVSGDSPASSVADFVNNWEAIEVMAGAWMQNLLIVPGSSPNTQVDISFDRLGLRDNVNTPPQTFVARDISATTLDITNGIAVNGLIAGSEATSTWYNIYCIYNPGGDLLKFGLLAQSRTIADDLSTFLASPSAYTFYRHIGAVYNDSSGHFVPFRQNDNRITYKDPQTVASVNRSDAAWSSAIDISVYVPSVVKRVSGQLKATQTGAVTNSIIGIQTAANSSGDYEEGRLRGQVPVQNEIIFSNFSQHLIDENVHINTYDSSGTINPDIHITGFEVII